MTPLHPSRRRLWLVAAPAALALTLSGCASGAATPAANPDSAAEPETTVDTTLTGFATAEEVLAGNQQTHDAAADAEWSEADAVTIELDGSGASAPESAGVTIDGATVTISAAGTYLVSGDLEGQLVVDSDDEGAVTLVLDGVDISNSDGAAIDIAAAAEAVIVLAEGSANTLSDANGYAKDVEANAALASAADLTITGSGSLSVAGNGNDGIASRDGLVIQSGAIDVDAVGDGIRGKDHLVVRGGDIAVDAGGDGLKADNEEDADRGYVAIEDGTVTLVSGGDGIDAYTDIVQTGGTVDIEAGRGSTSDPESGAKGIVAGTIAVLESGVVNIDAADDAINTNAYLHLAGADVTLASGDDAAHAELQLVVSDGDVTVTSSVEALEGGQITVEDGTIALTASDDAINVSEPDAGTAELTLVIAGGELVVDAGGDGLDANGPIEITGGTVIVHGPTADGNGAIDADGGVTVSSGTLLALGPAGMAQAPSADSAQATVQFTANGGIAPGTVLTIVSASGEQLGTVTATKQAQNLVFSAPGLTNGETYTLVADGATIATAVAGQQSAGGMGGPGGAPR
ncbi:MULTISPECIES: carbohydrate-binding domain-containing protein [unclassified Microbacterium]|uniref:carbohydrate-binding domain-containing protein n=1 Tax=unclassified Microbacterium TaxID=2609290 RepID=UPI00214C6601|nr:MULTISPECIES: carbohydrate-binding domain-containing protein [unclassified Microbacterium]MCR2783624.1 carbohydrate-binding domain-containing protein [Microbacterium sp. zg.B96]WIM15518.1 carbohydrate-binding domain-containing protein [Microbacterium sp. zg-B96]